MLTKTPQTAKYKRFVRRLRAMLPQLPIDVETVSVGILERLWHTTATSAPRGDIGKLEDELIAEMVGWYGPANELVRLLVECGWLDEDDRYRLVVHDWHDHAPNHVKGNVNRMGGFVTQRTGSDADSDSCPNDAPQGPSQATGPGDQPSHACGLPVQTLPNHTSPGQTRPDGALPGQGRPPLVVAIENVDRGEAVRQANKLIRACPSLGRELVWQIAWVGTALDPAFVGDLISRIKAGVRSPRNYAKGAIRKACEERGITWHSAVNCISKPPAISESIAG